MRNAPLGGEREGLGNPCGGSYPQYYERGAAGRSGQLRIGKGGETQFHRNPFERSLMKRALAIAGLLLLLIAAGWLAFGVFRDFWVLVIACAQP